MVICIFGCAGSLMPMGFLKLCEQGLLSGCSVQASRCVACLYCEAQALEYTGFSHCGTRDRSCGGQGQLPHSMRNLSGSGIGPPHWAGGLFTTGPPGNAANILYRKFSSMFLVRLAYHFPSLKHPSQVLVSRWCWSYRISFEACPRFWVYERVCIHLH